LKVVDVQKESETAEKIADLEGELVSLKEKNEVSLVVIKLVRKYVLSNCVSVAGRPWMPLTLLKIWSLKRQKSLR